MPCANLTRDHAQSDSKGRGAEKGQSEAESRMGFQLTSTVPCPYLPSHRANARAPWTKSGRRVLIWGVWEMRARLSVGHRLYAGLQVPHPCEVNPRSVLRIVTLVIHAGLSLSMMAPTSPVILRSRAQ